MPRIQTTVVGSYPVPDWLVARPSEQALIDATRVVFDTQEQRRHRPGRRRRALPLRHQPSRHQRHDRVLRAADGRHHAAIGRRRPDRVPRQQRHALPHPPAGQSSGRIDEGTLNLPLACARAKALTTQTFKFTAHRPAHARQDAARPALRRPSQSWRIAHGRRARRAGERPGRRRRADRRGQPPGPPGRDGTGPRRPSTRVLDAVPGTPACTCASATTAGRRSRRAPGTS